MGEPIVKMVRETRVGVSPSPSARIQSLTPQEAHRQLADQLNGGYQKLVDHVNEGFETLTTVVKQQMKLNAAQAVVILELSKRVADLENAALGTPLEEIT